MPRPADPFANAVHSNLKRQTAGHYAACSALTGQPALSADGLDLRPDTRGGRAGRRGRCWAGGRRRVRRRRAPAASMRTRNRKWTAPPRDRF